MQCEKPNQNNNKTPLSVLISKQFPTPTLLKDKKEQ